MLRKAALGGLLMLVLCITTHGSSALDASPGHTGSSSISSPGSAPSPPGPVTYAPDPGATLPPTPALTLFYNQQLNWLPCDASDQCAVLVVPEDYAHPLDAKEVTILVYMHPAEDAAVRVGDLVVNPGGPGESGAGLVDHDVDEFTQTERDDFDIVGFDPRGVGHYGVRCLTHHQMHHDLDLEAASPDPVTPAQIHDYLRLPTQFGRACARSSSEAVSHVSTVETARDMDILRAALGQSHLDYLGLSYGTKIGATYADLFSQRVGHLVLDGAVDLGVGSKQADLQRAGSFETALRSFLRDCVEDASFTCYFGHTVPAAERHVSRFLDRLEHHPQRTADGSILDAGEVENALIGDLYRRGDWDELGEGLESAMKGDGSSLLASYDGQHRPGYDYDEYETRIAVNCLDDPSFETPAEVERSLPTFDRRAPVFGRFFAWTQTSCDSWTLRSDEHPAVVRAHGPGSLARGAPPIMVIGTTRDPATPYVWAQNLAAELASGVLVTRDGDGHTAFDSGNACVDQAEDDFLTVGTVPAVGLSC